MNNEFGDIAFTPDGKLWGFENGLLFRIDTTNAETTLVGIIAINGVSLVDLNDSVLLMESKDSLWEINVNNLKAINIGNIGYSASGDLTWYDNNLYMTSGGLLIKIILNSANTNIISSNPINTINTPIPECYGIATASFPGLENSIIGWSRQSSYKICPIDGTYQLLCNPTVVSVPGAANIRLPIQNPLPTSCTDILPVQLINFTSSILNKTVNLQWETTAEINSDYFLIERSSDGINNFSNIGKVTAAGNSNSIKQYSFIDNDPFSVNYYRLKEVDLNGKYTYSKILQVNMPQSQALNIIGNPVQNSLQVQVNVSTSQTNYLSIFDFTGRRLKAFNAQKGIQRIDVSALQDGIYVLQMITADGQVYEKTFVKSR
jgi:hypothetical protein